jgi:ubiquinone/menaquinone biosynthesis C-methylase UbiE
MCIGFLEHLSFENEGRLLKEVQRVLMKGGVFRFTVPDFDNLCKQWLEAKDNFIDFYKIGTDEHWFGNGDRNIKNKWGYLLASFFGNQSCDGQFHRNAWTKKKIEKIMETLGFFYDIDTFYFKNTEILMLGCTAVKK